MKEIFDRPPECPSCRRFARIVGEKRGEYANRPFRIAKCDNCGFGFVVDRLEDLSSIYDENYYRGRGADPLVDYVNELENPGNTIRTYEWRGVLRAIKALAPGAEGARWLDYGCGNGGLVRHVRNNTGIDIVGFEEGWIADRAVAAGTPLVRREALLNMRGTFDIVTMIEVIEHVPDPHEILQAVRSYLKPGGILFYTTGNALPVPDLTKWSYVVPEIHVSFFEPRTLSFLLEQHGFRADDRGFLPGHDDIIRFKILKNLGMRHRAFYERGVPWGFLSKLVDKRYRVTGHPVGVAV